MAGENVLVAGRYEQLNREEGWVFQKANGNGFLC
jgi:hypothetical protein